MRSTASTGDITHGVAPEKTAHRFAVQPGYPVTVWYSNCVACARILLTQFQASLSVPLMETLELEPQVLANHRGVAFGLVCPNGTVECVITIATLEAYFWLEPRASDVRILKIFRNGYGRIRAIAERRLLAHPATRLELTSDDFARP